MFFRVKEALDYLATPLYVLRGKKPWSIGYYTAKKRSICSAIETNALSNDKNLPAGHGYHIDERSVEYPWVFTMLPSTPGKMLDAGSALNHRFLLDLKPLKNAQLTVMTLAPEKRCFWQRSISYVFGDLRKTDFADNVFDVVTSISTIEHIGLDNTLLYTGDSSKKESDSLGFVPAVMEFKRILKPGGLCLITVPYGRRTIESWYQVFDAELVKHIISAFNPNSYTIEYFSYKTEGWQRCEAEDIAEAEFFDINMNKSIPHDFAAGARGVACIRLVA